MGQWIVGVISFQKIYGLSSLKGHIVEIRWDVTLVHTHTDARKDKARILKQNSQLFSEKSVLLFFIQDHIAEVFEKWSNIEDEIWAKVGTLNGTFRNIFVPGDNFGKKQTSCKSLRTSSNPYRERI